MTKLRVIQKQQEVRRQTETLWNNRRLAETGVVFCIRKMDLVSNPFDTHGGVQWEGTVAFLWEHKKQTCRVWFGSSQANQDLEPTRWDELFRQDVEWPAHNYQLRFIVQGDPKKGYLLVWNELSDSLCPCVQFAQVQVKEAPLQIVAPNKPPQLIEAEVEPSTQRPATDAQKRKLLSGSTLLKTKGIVFDPGDMDTMSEYLASERIKVLDTQVQALRQEWIQQTAIQGTDKL